MSNYIERNRGFLTSSKIKEFKRCELCYYWKYELEIPSPIEDDPDYFVVGQAFDDLLTHGRDHFDKRYMVVARRTDKLEAENPDKTLLSPSLAATIDRLANEFNANPLFKKNPQKKVIEYDWSGVRLRAELDDYRPEERIFCDMKTCSNLTNFDPEDYVFQFSFYQWLLEETEGEKYQCLAEVVDKYTHFSRSIPYLYTKQTLEARRGEILDAIEAYKQAKESGLWLPCNDPKELLRCPYYGREGHGRPTSPIIY